MAVAKDISEIKSKLTGLLGKAAWKVALGHGSFITFEYGQPIEDMFQTSKGTRIERHGEWHLWIYDCGWYLQTTHEFLVGSEDTRENIEIALKSLVGVVLKSIELFPPSLETTIEFEGDIWLRIFPYSYTGELWMLFTPDGNVLTIGPNGKWSYRNANLS